MGENFSAAGIPKGNRGTNGCDGMLRAKVFWASGLCIALAGVSAHLPRQYVKPVLQALLLADHVYRDKETGKAVIAGVFDRFAVWKRRAEPSEPGKEGLLRIPLAQVLRAGNPFAYISLTEVRGRVQVQLRLVRLETNEICFESNPIPIECDDPLKTVQLVLPVPILPQVPGTYALELLCDNELVGAHRVVVEEVLARGDNP